MDGTLSIQQRIDCILENSEESTNAIVTDLIGDDLNRQKNAVQFLAALAVFPGGHSRALDCLAKLQTKVKGRYRFQFLLQQLRAAAQAQDVDFCQSLVSLVNCLLAGCDSLHDRLRLRNELIGLKLIPVLESMKSGRKSAGLAEEVERFDQMKLADEEEEHCSGPEGVDLNSHSDIFYTILKQVSDGPQEMLFLNILQHLMQIDNKDQISDVIWEAAEKMMARIKLIESKEEAEKLLRVQTSSQLIEKLKSEGRCHCNCHSKTSVPPPPAPPLPSPGAPPAPPLPPSFSSKIGNLEEEKTPAPRADGKLTFSEMLSQKKQKLNDGNGKTMTIPNPNRRRNFEHLDIKKSSQMELTSPPPNPQLPQQQVPAPKSKLKSFAWNKVSVTKVTAGIENNLWLKAADHFQNGFRLDFDRIEELFCQNSPNVSLEKAKLATTTPDGSVGLVGGDRRKKEQKNLLEPKRSLNVNIFLKQFRGGVDALIELVNACKSNELGLEKLRGLVKILPELVEIEILNAYDGDREALGEAESFFLRLIAVKDYRLRIESMLLREEFASLADYIKPSLDAMILAAQDLKNSTALQELLFLVLMVGNYLNAGSYGGNAAGFKMTSLWKLVEIRANKPNMTLLHYVALEAEKKNSKLLEFPAQMKYLEDASKLCLDSIKVDLRNLKEKTTKVSKQVAACSSEEILNQMNTYLEFAKDQLETMERDLDEVERLKIELAEFFCEDQAGFKLEECFKIFHTFCIRLNKAVQDNASRKLKEEKEVLKRRLQEQRDEKQKQQMIMQETSGSPLSAKYAALCSSRDVTLTTYRKDSTDKEDTGLRRDRSGVGQVAALMEVLEGPNHSRKGSGTNWGVVDAGSVRRSRRRGVQSLSIDRERSSTEKSKDGSTPSPSVSNTVPGTWRDRVEHLLKEEDKLIESELEQQPTTKRLSQLVDGGGSVGNLNTAPDPPTECQPIFARTRQIQREDARISSVTDLRLAATKMESCENDESKISSRLSSPRSSVRRNAGLYASTSALPTRSATAAGDLNELLQSLETEKQQHEILSRGRKYRWRESSAHESSQDSATTSMQEINRFKEEPIQESDESKPTDIDEIVRHCEKTKKEIDEMGKENAVWTGRNRSVRDSGFEETHKHSSPSPSEEAQEDKAKPLAFTFEAQVDNHVDSDEKSDNEDVQPKSDPSSDGEQWQSVTDVSDVDTRTPPEQSSKPASLADKDEGFETESHSTVCSVALAQDAIEEKPLAKINASKTAAGAQKKPSYLSGTKASSSRKETTAPTATKPAQGPSLVKRFVNSVRKPNKSSTKEETDISSKPTKKASVGVSTTPRGSVSSTSASSTPKSAIRSRAVTNRAATQQGTNSSSSSQNASPTRTPKMSSIGRKPITARQTLSNGNTSPPQPNVTPSQATRERLATMRSRMQDSRQQSSSSSDTSSDSHQRRRGSGPPRRAATTTTQASKKSTPPAPSGTASRRTTSAQKPAEVSAIDGSSAPGSKRWERLMSPPKSRLSSTAGDSTSSTVRRSSNAYVPPATTPPTAYSTIGRRSSYNSPLTSARTSASSTLASSATRLSRGNSIDRPASQRYGAPSSRRSVGFGSTADRFTSLWR